MITGYFINTFDFTLILQEEQVTPLGLSTTQALWTLHNQLSSLLEQHQGTSKRRQTLQVLTHTIAFIHE